MNKLGRSLIDSTYRDRVMPGSHSHKLAADVSKGLNIYSHRVFGRLGSLLGIYLVDLTQLPEENTHEEG